MRISLICWLAVMMAGASPSLLEAQPVWKKHVLQSASQTTGNINTAVANDWDHDGHMDVISSFNGAVILLPGPTWKKQITLYKFIDPKSGKPAKRGCIHSTLMDVDGDGAGD